MLRFLADENFNGAVVRGLLLRDSKIDIVTVQSAGLAGANDADVLKWAAIHDRVLITHECSHDPEICSESHRIE